MADAAHAVECDYAGVVSANDVPAKRWATLSEKVIS